MEVLQGKLCSCRNSCLPVNRLPPELLGIVFEHLLERNSRGTTNVDYPDYQWPTIQSVCRHWRETAIHTPALWNEIRFPAFTQEVRNTHSSLVSVSLEQSGAVPLNVFIEGDEGADSRWTASSLPNDLILSTPRFRELVMFSVPPASLFSFTKHTASQLEAISIFVGDIHRDRDSDGKT